MEFLTRFMNSIDNAGLNLFKSKKPGACSVVQYGNRHGSLTPQKIYFNIITFEFELKLHGMSQLNYLRSFRRLI